MQYRNALFESRNFQEKIMNPQSDLRQEALDKISLMIETFTRVFPDNIKNQIISAFRSKIAQFPKYNAQYFQYIDKVFYSFLNRLIDASYGHVFHSEDEIQAALNNAGLAGPQQGSNVF